jgi:hypothetical protein
MLYEWEFDGSIVSEEGKYDIAKDEVDGDDLWVVVSDKVDEQGFVWLWKNLSEDARFEIFYTAVENYCDIYFTEVEDEEE